MATLEGCSRLHILSLAGVAVDTSSLQRLASKSYQSFVLLQLHTSEVYMYVHVLCENLIRADLKLHLLKLPDRNFFFDDSMEVISGELR